MTIGERIEELREKTGFSQTELAEKIFVTPTAINKFEHNVKLPGIDTVSRLSKVFGCTTDFLILGEENKNSNTVLNEREQGEQK